LSEDRPAARAAGAQVLTERAAPADSRVRGFWTLFCKEWMRFWKVRVQTVLAPVLTALLYLLVFGYTLRDRAEPLPGIGYVAFLVPGLAMMSVLQNAFANASSSLVQAKMQGSIVFVLLPPISNREFFGAYLFAAMARGCLVGAAVVAATVWFVHLDVKYPLWILAFTVLGSGVMGALGVIAGIQVEKMDQLAAIQNFVILPLTFLSGVFYSVHALPPAWQAATHFNPMFYMIDGFRYGFFGLSDVSPWVSAAFVALSFAAVSLGALWMIASGYKLRH
jgi:ABC-2 type transport system permease protein